MRMAGWDGDDHGGVPDPERSLARTRAHLADGVMAWRSSFGAGVPSTRPDDLEPWIRGIKEFYAALPYRLVEEYVGPDPEDARRLVARLRFERTDIEQLRADLARRRRPGGRGGGGRGDTDHRRPPSPGFGPWDPPHRDVVLLAESLIHHRAELDRRLPVYLPRFSAPRSKRQLLDEWVRAMKELFAGHPYRLADEEITADATDPDWLTARLRFERLAPGG